MSASISWKCPGCGAIVVLSPECGADNAQLDDRRLDQLAQALCGCWVVKLPDLGLARILRAVMTGDDTDYSDWSQGAPRGC